MSTNQSTEARAGAALRKLIDLQRKCPWCGRHKRHVEGCFVGLALAATPDQSTEARLRQIMQNLLNASEDEPNMRLITFLDKRFSVNGVSIREQLCVALAATPAKGGDAKCSTAPDTSISKGATTFKPEVAPDKPSASDEEIARKHAEAFRHKWLSGLTPHAVEQLTREIESAIQAARAKPEAVEA